VLVNFPSACIFSKRLYIFQALVLFFPRACVQVF
jgi:hypothetical protein